MYEQYKKTDQVWLPHIPAQWKVEKIKHLFSERVEKGYPHELLLVSSQNMGVVPKSVYGNRTVEAQKDLHLLKLVRKGDFVISLRAFQGGIEYAYYQGIISPAYTIMVNKGNIASPYFKYLAKSSVFIDLLRLCVTGIREGQNIDYTRLKNFKIPIPPRTEQDQIVRFLDWKVSAINRLIGIKRKEIVCLEELQRTRIADVVMGKIANGKKRNTNIGWINCIPNHWEEKSLIQVSEEQKIRNEGMAENNLLSLSYGKIVTKDINTTDGLLPANFEGYQIVHSGNVILRLTDLQNDHRSLRTGFVNQTGIITSAYTCLKTRENILPKYLQLQLHIADLCKVFYGMGGGVRQSIGFKEIRKLRIVLPPISEQMDIINSVNSIESTIEHAIKKEKNHIKTLNELKTRLIADTVTGKIDVRNIEIHDYEFVGEESQAEEEIDAEGSENEG